MDDNFKSKSCKSNIISASEIGQFNFCSIAWYLEKSGFKPQSQYIDLGIKKHIEYGKIIDNSNYFLKKLKILIITGIIFLIIAFFIFLFKVIL